MPVNCGRQATALSISYYNRKPGKSLFRPASFPRSNRVPLRSAWVMYTRRDSVWNTPKAFANFSPGVGAPATTLGSIYKGETTLKGFANHRTLSGLERFYLLVPKVLASSNLGLKLANAFGVFSNYADDFVYGFDRTSITDALSDRLS